MQELIDKLTSYDVKFSGVFLNIIVAVIIIFLGFIFGKLLGRLLRRVLHEAEVDKVLKKIGFKISIEKKLSVITEYFIYVLSIVMALNQLGVTTTVLQIILGGFMILILLFVFISLKDFVPNAIAGFFIHRKKLFAKGDMIKVQDVFGKVENIGLVETEVVMKNKDRIYIPNSSVIKGKLRVKKK